MLLKLSEFMIRSSHLFEQDKNWFSAKEGPVAGAVGVFLRQIQRADVAGSAEDGARTERER